MDNVGRVASRSGPQSMATEKLVEGIWVIEKGSDPWRSRDLTHTWTVALDCSKPFSQKDFREAIISIKDTVHT